MLQRPWNAAWETVDYRLSTSREGKTSTTYLRNILSHEKGSAGHNGRARPLESSVDYGSLSLSSAIFDGGYLRVGLVALFNILIAILRKATGCYRTYLFLVKLQPWFLNLRWKTCLCAELLPWCLSLQRKTCPWAELSDDDDDDANDISSTTWTKKNKEHLFWDV